MKNSKRVILYSVLGVFLACLIFQYLKTNPQLRQKTSFSLVVFANNMNSYRKITREFSIVICNIATFINPDEAFGYEVLGYKYYILSRYSYNQDYKKKMIKKSFKNYQKSLKYYPRSTQLFNHLGFNYIETEEFDKALEMFNKTLSFDKKNKVALMQVPYIQSSFFKDYKSALANIEIYIKQYPDDTEAIFAKAWILSALNRHEEAINYYNKYLEYYPDSLSALINIAGCENQVKDYENALTHVEKGLQINPYSIYLLSHKIDSLANLGRYKEAKEIALQMIDNQRNFYGKYLFYFKLAKIQKHEGDLLNSEENFKKSKAIAQEFFDGYCSAKDYDVNDSDAKCYNVSGFLKHFEKNKADKNFIWYFY